MKGFHHSAKGLNMLWKRIAHEGTSVRWPTPEVATLEVDGEVVGFYWPDQMFKGQRDKLPTEIFNHQLVDLDVNDAQEVARFMTEYGVIFAPWSGYGEEMGRFNKFINDCWLPTKKRTKGQIRSMMKSFDDVCDPWHEKTRQLWKDEYGRMLELEYDYEPRLFMVSYDEVKACVAFIEDYVAITTALRDSNGTADDIAAKLDAGAAERLGIISGNDAVNTIALYDNCMRDMLRPFHPDIYLSCDDGIDLSDGGFWYTLDRLHEMSLMNGLAYQLFELNARIEDTRHCKECGRLFLYRQTKGKLTQRSQSSSLFCCDKCRNRNTQRKHREKQRNRA